MRVLLACLATLLVACPSSPPDPPPDDDDDATEAVTPAPRDDSWMQELPQEMTGAQGDHHSGISLQFDPDLRDAVTAMADCGSAVALCLDETQGDFDACVLSTPVCQTDEPWNEGPCCPAACAEQFRAARDAGQAPFDAYVRSYALDGSCFPGVPERLQ